MLTLLEWPKLILEWTKTVITDVYDIIAPFWPFGMFFAIVAIGTYLQYALIRRLR